MRAPNIAVQRPVRTLATRLPSSIEKPREGVILAILTPSAAMICARNATCMQHARSCGKTSRSTHVGGGSDANGIRSLGLACDAARCRSSTSLLRLAAHTLYP